MRLSDNNYSVAIDFGLFHAMFVGSWWGYLWALMLSAFLLPFALIRTCSILLEVANGGAMVFWRATLTFFISWTLVVTITSVSMYEIVFVHQCVTYSLCAFMILIRSSSPSDLSVFTLFSDVESLGFVLPAVFSSHQIERSVSFSCLSVQKLLDPTAHRQLRSRALTKLWIRSKVRANSVAPSVNNLKLAKWVFSYVSKYVGIDFGSSLRLNFRLLRSSFILLFFT